MIVRIEGTNLPGRRSGCYENVHVGVQRKAEVVDLVAGDAESAVWEVEVVVKDGPDFAGPYVHGKKGDRFLYLSWGTMGAAGGFQMFRRAKLMLAAVDAGLVASAAAAGPGARLVCRLGLTGGDGGPRCAAVKPPNVEWGVDSAAGVGEAGQEGARS